MLLVLALCTAALLVARLLLPPARSPLRFHWLRGGTRGQPPTPLIVAHRCGRPENTVAAAQASIKAGAAVLQVDAMLTRDGCVVVFHDVPHEGNVRRVLGIAGARICDLDASQLPSVPLLSALFKAIGRGAAGCVCC